ncbi:MAG: tetratricopeptide repeat protein [Nitrospirae bacterium]|nr:tetratricopeptide repeat protein [Nitrospirota bacterium]
MEPEEEIEELRRLFEQINTFYFTGKKDDECDALFKEAIEKSKNIEAYRLFFEGLRDIYNNGDYKLVEDLFRKAVEIRPEDYFLIGNLGVCLFLHGKTDESIKIFDEALRIKPDDYLALVNKGVALSTQGKDDEAMRCYDEALKVKPDSYRSLHNKGASLSRQGKEDEAIIYFDEALKIQPDLYHALHDKGVSLSHLGKDDEAIRCYDKTLKIRPGYSLALRNKALSLTKLGKVKEAILCLQEEQKIKPDDDANSLSTQDKEEIAAYKLKSIELKGYKSIDSEGQRIEFGDVTVLIGPNGAGKSNFISFFKMINKMMDNDLKSYIEEKGGASSFLYFGDKTTPSLSAEIIFSDDKDIKKNSYRFSLVCAEGDTFVFKNEEFIYYTTGISERHSLTLNTRSESTLKNEMKNVAGRRLIYDLLKKCLVYQFHDTSSTAGFRKSCNISDDISLQGDGSNLAAILYAMANNPATVWYYERIVSQIGAIFPQFADFVLEPAKRSPNQIEIRWKGKGRQHVFYPNQLSDGSLRFMALTTLLLQPPEWLPRVIIIDEPELGLHPTAVAHLAEMVLTAGEHVQVIIATQSPHLVDEFEADQIVIVEQEYKDDNGDRTGSSKFKKLDKDEYKEWLLRYRISDLWERNLFGGNP